MPWREVELETQGSDRCQSMATVNKGACLAEYGQSSGHWQAPATTARLASLHCCTRLVPPLCQKTWLKAWRCHHHCCFHCSPCWEEESRESQHRLWAVNMMVLPGYQYNLLELVQALEMLPNHTITLTLSSNKVSKTINCLFSGLSLLK